MKRTQIYLLNPQLYSQEKIDVDSHNTEELSKLKTLIHKFIAEDSYTPAKGVIIDSRKLASYETVMNEMSPKEALYKIGAQVMLQINLNVDGGLANGSTGVIMDIVTINEQPIEVIVKFMNNTIVTIIPHAFSYKDELIKFIRKQIPLKLAWALTIHKIQGSTIDNNIIVDLGSNIFTEGQAYVGISRVPNINFLLLSNFNPKSLKCNNEAITFISDILSFSSLKLPLTSEISQSERLKTKEEIFVKNIPNKNDLTKEDAQKPHIDTELLCNGLEEKTLEDIVNSLPEKKKKLSQINL